MRSFLVTILVRCCIWFMLCLRTSAVLSSLFHLLSSTRLHSPTNLSFPSFTGSSHRRENTKWRVSWTPCWCPHCCQGEFMCYLRFLSTPTSKKSHFHHTKKINRTTSAPNMCEQQLVLKYCTTTYPLTMPLPSPSSVLLVP